MTRRRHLRKKKLFKSRNKRRKNTYTKRSRVKRGGTEAEDRDFIKRAKRYNTNASDFLNTNKYGLTFYLNTLKGIINRYKDNSAYSDDMAGLNELKGKIINFQTIYPQYADKEQQFSSNVHSATPSAPQDSFEFEPTILIEPDTGTSAH